jgi:hypothetical protein
MLASGCAVCVESVHGEAILVISGPLAGLRFTAVQELESDVVLDASLSIDPRAKRIVRFRMPNVPALSSQDVVQTEDGRRWYAIRKPGNQYLTVDFELSLIIPGKDS